MADRRAGDQQAGRRGPKNAGAGVSNQPPQRDQAEQRELPPRGRRKAGDRPPHA